MVRLRLAALAAALGSVLVACTGDEGGSDGAEDLDARLTAAEQTLDEAASIDIEMSADSLPSDVTGLLSATGTGTHDPAFTGDVTVATGGGSIDAEVISVDGTVYAKIGFVPAFTSFDPASVGAPDPADLFDPETGVSTFLGQTESPEEGEQTRDGDEVLTTVTGTLPGDVVSTLIPSADEDAAFDVSYRLTDDDTLRSAVIEGPFYPGAEDVRYDLSLTASDETVDITAP